MAALLKSAGKGLLYILVLPLLLVVLAVYLVVGIVIFAYIGIKAIILFFTGRNLTELPEDLKAREILEGKSNKSNDEVKPQEKEIATNNTDFMSHYYMPIDQSIPSPNEESNNVDNKEEGGEK